MKLRLIWTLALLSTAGTCAEVNQLREAQDAFNRAAAAENEHRIALGSRMEGSGSEGMASWTLQQTGYASALTSLKALEKDAAQKKALVEEGLWGTALSLKALCQWKLGDADNARKTAADAEKQTSAQLYPRDRAMLQALPGLIMIDQGYAKVLKKREAGSGITLEDIETLLVKAAGAVGTIDVARKMVDADHPVQVYFVQAQLAAYRNYLVAYRDAHDKNNIPETDDSSKAAKNHLGELKKLVSNSPGGSELVAYWTRLCILPAP